MNMIIGVVFLVFVVVIGMTLINNGTITPDNSQMISGSSISEEYVEITLTGEVINEGTYEVLYGSYLQDALQLAGGVSDDADSYCFDYYLVLDKSMSIYIPYETTYQKTSINSEDIDELTSLAGIGTTLGNRILDYRNENGDFSYLEQIMEVEGIGQSIFNKVKDQICL